MISKKQFKTMMSVLYAYRPLVNGGDRQLTEKVFDELVSEGEELNYQQREEITRHALRIFVSKGLYNAKKSLRALGTKDAVIPILEHYLTWSREPFNYLTVDA